MNVFDFAMEMEDNGYEYYSNLAKTSDLPGLQTIFANLAEDERKHFTLFRSLKEGGHADSVASSKALEKAQNIFKDLPAEATALTNVKGTLEAYQYAMKLEADSFRFYEDAAACENDPVIKKLLMQIAEEEHNHFTILENLYNFVNAPNEHLAWAEFSNLGEFRQYGRDPDK